ncbi:uncharacterized protein LOC112341815 isoform X1 [Selaginella moellendorffii]|uniref:uncharacterized protein LOC112341815 isoform X1 n=1 Tax=Selaginella moellendorffii TaxID=88036 RepID=UPI000D1CADDA|nr:uncharacterized protein LOC112341815 isoform X1 [Selaginella moellendorffii]|eukprot:XP_024518356.1 uncharacterized protein LOC112341815 isoform X1 [Selaginella moellendorffii]
MHEDSERTARALDAMAAIGLPRKFVLGVLTEALKVYNGWAFLEQNHFEVLAELCLDQMQEADTLAIESGTSMKSSSTGTVVDRGKEKRPSRCRASPAAKAAGFKASTSSPVEASRKAAAGAKVSSSRLKPVETQKPAVSSSPLKPVEAQKPAAGSKEEIAVLGGSKAFPPANKKPRTNPERLGIVLEPFIFRAPTRKVSPYGDFPSAVADPMNGAEHSKQMMVTAFCAGGEHSKQMVALSVQPLAENIPPEQDLALAPVVSMSDQASELSDDPELPSRGFSPDAWALSLINSQYGDDD